MSHPIIAAGFLPFRGSLMLDVVFLAMFLIMLAMAISVFHVRFRKRFLFHKQVQVGLTLILIVAIVAFEVDMRFFTDWKEGAKASPYYESGMVGKMLFVHLLFAIPTPFVWCITIWLASRHFATLPGPNDHSKSHRFWGRVSAAFMFLTGMTGVMFYWTAYIA